LLLVAVDSDCHAVADSDSGGHHVALADILER
jgi:hypothetical protein